MKNNTIKKVLLVILIPIWLYTICYSVYGVRNPLAPVSHLITSPIDIITFQKIDKYQKTLKNILEIIENDY